ncbi:hypothetical protein LSAT2_003398, partial [Lamellibrachia satsuma]
ARTYYRWSNETTHRIREAFAAWITLTEGKKLPCKAELVTFISETKLDCSVTQLRTKIMNEQSKQQQLFKKRWLSMQT